MRSVLIEIFPPSSIGDSHSAPYNSGIQTLKASQLPPMKYLTVTIDSEQFYFLVICCYDKQEP